MKKITYILLAFAILLIGFNLTQLNFSNLLEGKSLIALIGIIGVLCAVVLLLIFKLSKSIEDKLKNQ